MHVVLVGKLGFDLTDAALKRAGLDYWKFVSWEHEPDREAYFRHFASPAFHLLTTHGKTPYTHMPVAWGDSLVFGKETAGLPKSILERHARQCYTIPMAQRGVRSLNLSSAVAVVLYDALRRVRPF